MLEEEVGKQNAEWVGYATPNKASYELLDKNIREDERFYPDLSTRPINENIKTIIK